MLSPVITFIGYALLTRYASRSAPDAATIFSSLSLLSILIAPAGELVGALPNLNMALDSCTRIQNYAARTQRQDFRLPFELNEATNRMNKSDPRRFTERELVIDVRNANVAWSPDRTVLKSCTLSVHAGTLTCIIGPTGSGKSTLLHLLLGECLLMNGECRMSTTNIAFCHQNPFLLNQTIQDNITFGRHYDTDYYNLCLQACALEDDMRLLPDGDATMVGSKAVALSGGQRQRISLARALYSRKPLVLLDDCFSALDGTTSRKCFDNLFGLSGIFRKMGTTVVLATHSVDHMSKSDRIIVLDKEGSITQMGYFEALIRTPGYVKTLASQHRISMVLGEASTASSSEPVLAEVRKEPAKVQARQVKQALSQKKQARGEGDSRNIVYYLATMGKLSFAFFAFLVVLQVVFTALQPLWLAWWVSATRNSGDSDLGKWLTVYALFGVLALAFLGLSGGFYLIQLIPRSASTLHLKVLQAVSHATWSFIAKTDSGQLLNRFSQDMTMLDMELPMALLLFSSASGNAVAQSILTCVSSGYMAICLPIVALILYGLQKVYLKTSRQIRLLDLEAKAPLLTHLTETIDGLTTIRAYGMQAEALSRNHTLVDDAQRPFYLLMCLQNWLNLVLNLVAAFLVIVLVGLVVGLRSSTNNVLLGVALSSIVSFSDTLSTFVTYWSNLETSLGVVARTRDFIATTPSEPTMGIVDPPDDWTKAAGITFNKVSAGYSADGPNVIEDVSFSIRPGEKVALCGRTGSGKSTLITILLRLLDPVSGIVSIGNIDLSTIAPEVIRSNMTCLPQDPWFMPSGAVRLNLDSTGLRSDAELNMVLEKTQLLDQIELMGGLDADMNSTELSAGQRQLFCLARAMISKKGGILLLDEPTSSLDVETERLIMTLIRDEFADWTVLAVAHRLSTISDFDKVIVLNAGHVEEIGNPSELLACGDSAFAALMRD